MKNEKRHEMNLGAEAERKALRGIVAKLYKQHILDICARDSMLNEIDDHIERISKRPGGIGRK